MMNHFLSNFTFVNFDELRLLLETFGFVLFLVELVDFFGRLLVLLLCFEDGFFDLPSKNMTEEF
jgi:hypothetical protein